jgi:hypothetical protein
MKPSLHQELRIGEKVKTKTLRKNVRQTGYEISQRETNEMGEIF